MPDKVLFHSDRNDLDGRTLSVTAERGYGDVITLKVFDEDGGFTIYLHEPDEASWLGNALVDAWAALQKSSE